SKKKQVVQRNREQRGHKEHRHIGTLGSSTSSRWGLASGCVAPYCRLLEEMEGLF
ncbi:MAG: hypothetical protein ACI819_002086, partial [Neolewinella sp.]